MTPEIPDILRRERILWQGIDDTTPAHCTLITAEVLGLVTTYVLGDGEVLGRIESDDGAQNGYAGAGLKGGHFLGTGGSTELAQRIVEHAGRPLGD